MELVTARPDVPAIPPPPRAGRRQLTPSVLDVLLPAAAPLPSVLDVDAAVLAATSAAHARPPQPAPSRTTGLAPDDDEADRRVERVRVLVTGGVAAALVVVSAGALHLAL